MNHLRAQQRAVRAVRIRNHHIRVLNALIGQTSAFDREILEALRHCTPSAQVVIQDACDKATHSLADVLATYILANGADPFRSEPLSLPEPTDPKPENP